MNDKKAKKLRSIAQAVAPIKERMLILQEKYIPGKGIVQRFVNHPETVRGVYRRMKRG